MVEFIRRVDIRHVIRTHREGRHLHVAVNAEHIARRNLQVWRIDARNGGKGRAVGIHGGSCQVCWFVHLLYLVRHFVC